MLAEFLHFNLYESHFILRNLASKSYQRELELTNLNLAAGDEGLFTFLFQVYSDFPKGFVK